MNKRLPLKISIIVTTYNWPNALRAVLDALLAQKTTQPFEIIVADNGSGIETAKMIRDLKNRTSISVLHIWQPNTGFGKAAIRNKAILAAEGDYIVFLEGDCIPCSNFIMRHAKLAEAKKFMIGNRLLLSRSFTVSALTEMLPLYRWSFWQWCLLGLKGQYKGAKGYHLGIWKSDLCNVNGLEENLTGLEDEYFDLMIRLKHFGVRAKNSWFTVPVMQLWCPQNAKVQKRHKLKLKWLKARQTELQVNAEKGLNQYAI